MAALNRNAVKLALPALFEAMADPKWQTKQVATNLLGHLADASPEQISVRAGPRCVWITCLLAPVFPAYRLCHRPLLCPALAPVPLAHVSPTTPHLRKCPNASTAPPLPHAASPASPTHPAGLPARDCAGGDQLHGGPQAHRARGGHPGAHQVLRCHRQPRHRALCAPPHPLHRRARRGARLRAQAVRHHLRPGAQGGWGIGNILRGWVGSAETAPLGTACQCSCPLGNCLPAQAWACPSTTAHPLTLPTSLLPVQSVDARTLSILVPLLVRGLTDRTTPIRRKACVIIRNMAKVRGRCACCGGGWPGIAARNQSS